MKKYINPSSLIKPLGNYSQAILVDLSEKKMLCLTGQVALDNKGKVVGENDITIQTECIFRNIELILKEAGGKLLDIVRLQNFITNMDLYPEFAVIRDEYLQAVRPASTLVEVPRLFKPGLLIEVEVMALIPINK